jgi:hypothetical protein
MEMSDNEQSRLADDDDIAADDEDGIAEDDEDEISESGCERTVRSCPGARFYICVNGRQHIYIVETEINIEKSKLNSSRYYL